MPVVQRALVGEGQAAVRGVACGPAATSAVASRCPDVGLLDAQGEVLDVAHHAHLVVERAALSGVGLDALPLGGRAGWRPRPSRK